MFKENMSSSEDLRCIDLEKNFSNAVITWDIDSFSLITATQKLICTPKVPLQGPIETLWKLSLYIHTKKNILLKVEMLPESQISKVKLHWAFCLLDETEKGSFSIERTYTYEPNTVLTLEYISLENALEIVKKKKYDNLILKCRMLVDFGEEIAFPKPQDVGVEHLSNSLYNLPTSFLYHDTTTLVNNVEFSLHNAMLFFRGTNLVRFMEQSASDEGDRFSLLKNKAATAVLQYLYTGDFKFILEDPCLTTSDYTKYLDIPEMEDVYSPQRMTVSSKNQFEDHTVFWKVPNLKKMSGTTFGPEFKIDGVAARFQLILNIKESKEDPPKKSLSVELKLIESPVLLVLRLEFAFGKDGNLMLCTKRIHDVMSPIDRLGVTFLEKDCPEMKECFLNETLLIKLKIDRSVGQVHSYIEKNENPTSRKVPNEKSFKSLSETLGEMKKTAVYSDLYFQVGDREIEAHKFLVAVRSPLMKELLRRHEGLNSVDIYGCTREVFENFLCYMYTGILTENDCDKLIELYNFGEQYHVDGFVKNVLTDLSKCINETNMLKILIFADEIDDALKSFAFKYVVSKGDAFQNHDDHDMFRCKKPDIYRNIENELHLK